MIPLIASLETVSHAGGIHALRERSFLLTGYLIALLGESKHEKKAFTVITPESEEEHGCQLSLKIEGGEKVMMRVFEGLVRRGVMGDERKPEVIRLS
jgi:kynureninase